MKLDELAAARRTHKAFGPFASFFAGFAAWWPGVLVMLSTGTVVSQLVQYLAGWTFAPWLQADARWVLAAECIRTPRGWFAH